MKFKLFNIEFAVRRASRPPAKKDFFTQCLTVKKYEGQRIGFLAPYCKGKRVLHVGCTDHPVFNPENNLHIQLNEIAGVLHGLDTDREGCAELQKHVHQPYFQNFADLTDSYDVCLVPETIEHVDNVRLFLEALSTVEAERFIITGPNCFAPMHINRNVYDYERTYVEIVHQDHNAWYSPFTLKNVIEKYSRLKVIEVAVIHYECSVVCVCSKR